MTAYRFAINNDTIDNPKNWEAMAEKIIRDEQARMIRSSFEFAPEFGGSGFVKIQSLIADGGYCQKASLKIYQVEGDGEFLRNEGVIMLETAKTTGIGVENIAKVEVTFNKVSETILTTQDLKSAIGVGISRNGVTYTPAPIVDLILFNPVNNANFAGTRKGYDWLEALNDITQYLSDGELTVVSDFYDNLPDNERYAIYLGTPLKDSTVTRAPELEWGELWMNMALKYNLWAVLQVENNANVIRIEVEDFFFQTGSAQILNSTGITSSADTSKIYSGVEVGSEEGIRDFQQNRTLPYIDFLTHTKETFTFENDCTGSSVLNLVTSYIIDNNTIEVHLINVSVDDHDDSIFMIQYDQSINQATRTKIINDGNPNTFWYNGAVINFEVLPRFRLQADIIRYTSSQDDLFNAVGTDTIPIDDPGLANFPFFIFTPFGFQNDFSGRGFDINNNYGNGTPQGSPVSDVDARYTAPTNSLYRFEINLDIDVISIPGGFSSFGRYYITFNVFNAGGTINRFFEGFTTSTPKATQGLGEVLTINSQAIGLREDFWFQQFYLQTGEYVEIELNYVRIKMDMLPQRNWELVSISDSGGLFLRNDPTAYMMDNVELDRPIAQDNWDEIFQSPAGAIDVISNDDETGNTIFSKVVWPLDITRQIHSGDTKFKGITNLKGSID